MPVGGVRNILWVCVASAAMSNAADAQPHVPIVPVQGPGIAPPAQPGASGFSKAGAAIDRSMSGFSSRMKTLFSARETIESNEVPSPWINSEKARNPDPELYTSFAELQLQQGNLPGAEDQYKKALAKDPKYLPAMVGLAQVYDRMGQPGRAQEQYKQAIAAHPREASVHNDLAVCYLQHGHAAEAIQEFEKAIALDPRNKLYRNNIARPLIGLERNADAYAQLSAVYDPAVAFYNMGYLLHEKGDRSGALLHFRRALEVKPDFVEAKQWCTSLDGQFQPRAPGMGYQPLLARQMQARPPSTPQQYAAQPFVPTAPVNAPVATAPVPSAPAAAAPMMSPPTTTPAVAMPVSPPPTSQATAAPSLPAPVMMPTPVPIQESAPPASSPAPPLENPPATPSSPRTHALPPLAAASGESETPPLVPQAIIPEVNSASVAQQTATGTVVDLPAPGPETTPAANPFQRPYEELASESTASPASIEAVRHERVAARPESKPLAGVHHFPSHDWTGEAARETIEPQQPVPPISEHPSPPTAEQYDATHSMLESSDDSYWTASGVDLTGDAALSMLTPPSDLALMAGEFAEQSEATTTEPAADMNTDIEAAPVEQLVEQEIAPAQPNAPERWVMPAPRSAFRIRENGAAKPSSTAPASASKPMSEPRDEADASQWRAYRAPSRY